MPLHHSSNGRAIKIYIFNTLRDKSGLTPGGGVATRDVSAAVSTPGFLQLQNLVEVRDQHTDVLHKQHSIISTVAFTVLSLTLLVDGAGAFLIRLLREGDHIWKDLLKRTCFETIF